MNTHTAMLNQVMCLWCLWCTISRSSITAIVLPEGFSKNFLVRCDFGFISPALKLLEGFLQKLGFFGARRFCLLPFFIGKFLLQIFQNPSTPLVDFQMDQIWRIFADL